MLFNHSLAESNLMLFNHSWAEFVFFSYSNMKNLWHYFSSSWGCIKRDCKARFTQDDNTYILKEIRPHDCQKKDHKTAEEKITSLRAKLKIREEKATTAKASFNLVEDA